MCVGVHVSVCVCACVGVHVSVCLSVFLPQQLCKVVAEGVLHV